VPMDNDQILRERRKQLVLAAEAVARTPRGKPPEPSQLSRLISICSDASCTEEIANYIRYQASRRRPPWPLEFADLVIERMDATLTALESDARQRPTITQDGARVAAWRHYAVYLSRALTYARAAGRDTGSRDAASRDTASRDTATKDTASNDVASKGGLRDRARR
jgi:hypothetical protein